MHIVINISEKVYKRMKLLKSLSRDNECLRYILEGTPLPKGHGNLIDTDVLINNLNRDFLTFERELCYDVEPANALAEVIDIIKDISTIIEADKAESEDNNGTQDK